MKVIKLDKIAYARSGDKGSGSNVGLIFLNKKLSNKLYYNIEAKAVLAKANIPIAGGSFDLPNVSLHVLLGISFSI